jgi:MoaA/NifB/PqqE/SkfB family radical SAM enzyme
MRLIPDNLVIKLLKTYNRSRSIFYKKHVDPVRYKPFDKSYIKKYNDQRPYGPMPRLCYAPWTNLFFNTSGKAIICCKNTKLILGQYPQNSIHDIWFNSNINILREHINNNDLTLGCYKCSEAMVQDNVSTTTSTYYDKYGLLPLKKYPRIIELELSNRCNLECIMCSGRVSSSILKNRECKDNIDTPYDDEFVKQLEEFIPHADEVKFYGGEPFLINIYYDIWNLIFRIKPSIKIYVQTNATILNDRIKSLFKNPNFICGVSLDSLNKENYEKIRINAKYEETMRNIEWFGKNVRNLTVIATPFKDNWKEIPAILEFCNTNKYFFSFSPVFYPVDMAIWNMELDEMNQIVDYYKSLSLSNDNWVNKKNNKVYYDLINSIEYWIRRKKDDNDFNNNYFDFISKQGKELANIKNTISVSEINENKKAFLHKMDIIKSNNPVIITLLENNINNFLQNNTGRMPNDIIFVSMNKSSIEEILFEMTRISESEVKQEIIEIYNRMLSTYIIK